MSDQVPPVAGGAGGAATPPASTGSCDVLPWGETLAELAEAVLADHAAPPVLALAAFAAKHGDDTALRELVGEALDLHAAEMDGDLTHVEDEP